MTNEKLLIVKRVISEQRLNQLTPGRRPDIRAEFRDAEEWFELSATVCGDTPSDLLPILDAWITELQLMRRSVEELI